MPYEGVKNGRESADMNDAVVASTDFDFELGTWRVEASAPKGAPVELR